MRQSFIFAMAMVFLSGCKQGTAPELDASLENQVQDIAKTATVKSSIADIMPINIAGINFGLHSTGTSCELIIEGQDMIDLQLFPNCTFNIKNDGSVRIVKGHHGPVFMVQSFKKSNDASLSLSEACETLLKTVTIVDNKAYVQPTPSRSAGCAQPNTDWDEKFFLNPQFDKIFNSKD